ncbi:MAG TPA: TlpA disulfide reductase family protein [Blastocatellia bacterium]|nr:TlpA disulfide reductase family protein [Blastocatellia bacterium]
MKLLIVLALALALTAPALSSAQNAAGTEPLKALPEVHLVDFDGKPVKADSLKGSVYVFDFWATWCGPCLLEIPVWNQLQAKYGDKGLKVIGVTMASGDAKEVKPFVAKRNMKYTVLLGDDDQTYDLNVIGFPTTYVVTGDMKIYSKYIGTSARKAAKIEADIQEILKRQATTATGAANDH